MSSISGELDETTAFDLHIWKRAILLLKPPFILSIGVMGFCNSSIFYKAATFTAHTDVNFIISCQRERETDCSGCKTHPFVALFFPWLFWCKWNMSSLLSLMQWPGWDWQRSDLCGKWELEWELGNKREADILDVLLRCAVIIICAFLWMSSGCGYLMCFMSLEGQKIFFILLFFLELHILVFFFFFFSSPT